MNEKAGGYEDKIELEQLVMLFDVGIDDFILDIRSSLKTATVFLKHGTNKIFFNGYNMSLLTLWDANVYV